MNNMEKRKLCCYGDSNTYGYDPAELIRLKYPEASIWTRLVQDKLGEEWIVENHGMNGRQLPLMALEGKELIREIRALGPRDLFFLMLGTNDILLAPEPDAARPLRKMEELLAGIQEEKLACPELCKVIIGAPVLIGKGLDPDELYYRESLKMNIGYQVLTKQYGVELIDATAWEVPLAFDHVHFSEEGHRVFAEHFIVEFKKHIS